MRVKTKTIAPVTPEWEEPDEYDRKLVQFSRDRRLDCGFLSGFGVGVGSHDSDKPGWIAFPYSHLSGVWHTRYRNPGHDSGPKYYAAPGSETHLYNPLHLGPNADLVWFSEGEIDCLTLIAAGEPCIGIPGVGIAKQVFASEWRLLFESATVIVAFDPDEAGQQAAVRLAQAFAPRSYVFDAYPEGIEDMNDWWIDDADGMIEALTAFKVGNGI